MGQKEPVGVIRPATPPEAEVIAMLWNQMIEGTTDTFTTVPKTTEDMRHMIATRCVLVAEVAGVVAGFATYGPFRSGPGYAQTVEHTVVMAPGARGTGAAKALLTHLMAAARAECHHVMVAAISATNARALAFHATMGFVEVARMPEVGRKWGQWLDLVLMQKTL